MKNTLKYIGLIIILFIIGFLIRGYFFELSISQLIIGNTQIVNLAISGQFYFHITFALSIGFIPLLYLIIKKLTKLNFINQGLISTGIIIACGVLFWQFRIFQLNNKFKSLANYYTEEGAQMTVSFNNLNLALYLFIGFLVGTILSVIIFKPKEASKKQ